MWQEFVVGHVGAQKAEEEGLEPPSEVLQNLSDDVRYRHELITAEETESWLGSRGLSLDDLTAYAHRQYWKYRALPSADEPAIDYLGAAPELRNLCLHDLIFGGEFDELARRLSWRVAAKLAIDAPIPALASRIDSERARFVERTSCDPASHVHLLALLGRDERWLDRLLEQEAVFGWTCEQLRTTENRTRTLAALRLPLTCLEVELMDLESADAVREACLCLKADGLSLAELATQEHFKIERRTALLETFPETLQPRLLSAEAGQVIELITADERFQVCRIANKRDPSLTDENVLARLDAEILQAHFGHLAAKHIVWLTGPATVA